jgi:mRNA-degrading endonuclease HigB of HigAB toxin-antitoxin module
MKRDINSGDYIKRKPYPDRYRRLGVHNLFVFDIGNTLRLIYTIRTTKDAKTYQYLDLLTHKEYDIIFGYSTS